ncbi:hypothetical protein AJ79_02422 [Helicocarpus griseus UAMH5409]|uniref:poly(ADP-ribose) glycohydrolase n=1 Tax=Helicocarpus griseus UAMH5409 TaxID=1447875 RepID=A0A2B7Y2N1_9EURO|nr:hypothetical protein AJ79_02422 [Helicocarpus griseus UAMH5409]
MAEMRFTLPCSPGLLCVDRFSLVESDEDEVPFWQIVETVLSSRTTNWGELIEQLETISVSLRSSSLPDYDTLRDFLLDEWELPQLFPEHTLPCLYGENRKLSLSRRQVASLVVHQFLCTLPHQPWATDSSQDFHIWYSSGSRHPMATGAYLHSLFIYFERLAGAGPETESGPANPVPSPLENDWPIIFTLRILQEDRITLLDSSLLDSGLCPLTVIHLPVASTEPSLLGLPDGACVISANKNVGFGQTGTQEEVQVGSSPECCPVTLLTPTLQDNQVLVVQGAEAMAVIKGYGREARLDYVLTADYGLSSGDLQLSKWRQRTMLFMDALQLDQFGVSNGEVADLPPGHVDRELLKAYNAFRGSTDEGECNIYSEIVTGLWGCGAFGGSPRIKTLIQWCAASMARTKLRIVLSGEEQGGFARELSKTADMARESSWTVRNILESIGL